MKWNVILQLHGDFNTNEYNRAEANDQFDEWTHKTSAARMGEKNKEVGKKRKIQKEWKKQG